MFLKILDIGTTKTIFSKAILMHKHSCSGIILAGGLNTRMGENKAFLTIQGERIPPL